jgi:hypothetical protein
MHTDDTPFLTFATACAAAAQGIKDHVPGFSAWRWAFFIPGGIYILCGIVALLFGQVRRVGLQC